LQFLPAQSLPSLRRVGPLRHRVTQLKPGHR
jgi:hypothetical protein